MIITGHIHILLEYSQTHKTKTLLMRKGRGTWKAWGSSLHQLHQGERKWGWSLEFCCKTVISSQQTLTAFWMLVLGGLVITTNLLFLPMLLGRHFYCINHYIIIIVTTRCHRVLEFSACVFFFFCWILQQPTFCMSPFWSHSWRLAQTF